MKRIKSYLLGFFTMSLMGLVLVGCESNNDASGTSTIMVRMTDAPGDYDEVNIDVRDVLMKTTTDGDDSEGWVSIGNVTPGMYNLLDLTGGVSVLLADNVVPSGYLGQIRLLLGDNNTVVKDGVTHVLNTPSAQQSGLKLKINQTLLAGATYDFLLDFDVEHSIVVQAGTSGNFNLHPVVRVSTMATSGVIKGTISGVPADATALAVSVIVGEETISAYANEEGMFQLNGVPEGTYDVEITYELATVPQTQTVPGIAVINGEITDMGDTVLE